MSSNSNKEKINALKKIPSVGDLKARILWREGYRDKGKLLDADIDDLKEISEIGERNAKDIVEKKDPADEGIKEEIFCPECGVVVYIDEDNCSDCGQSILVEGKVFHSEGEIEDPLKTLAEYEKRIMDGEEDPELYYCKAAIIEKMGIPRRALELYDRVIELDPLYDHIWTAKANLSLRLGKLKEATKAYKVAVNKHQINLPEMPELEEEEDVVEEKAISVKEVESKVGEARRSYFSLKRENIPTDHLESKLREAVDARNNDDRETAIEKSDELLSYLGQVKELSSIYDEIMKGLQGIESENLIEKLKIIDSEIEEGRYEKAKESCHELLSDIEKVKEEKEVEDDLAAKIEDMEEELVTEEKFLLVVDEAKESLNEIRKTNIKIDNIKELIKKTVESRKAEDYEAGIDHAREALALSKKVKEIDSLIGEGREKIKELREMGGQIKPFLSKLRKGKELADKGRYEEAKEIYEVTIRDINTVLDGGELDIIDDEATPEEKIGPIKYLIDTAEYLGMDTGSASDYLEKIEEEDGGEGLLSETREEIFKDFPDYMSDKVKSAKDELKEAKLSGADIDVSRCIHLLKQARKAEKRGDYESAIENMKEYQEELDSA